MKLAWSLSMALALAATGARAEGFDPDAALSIPGVRLVAVEFYATWCKPCMEAVPRWKALHEKYRREGLRLVVVATQDPAGGCSNPGWNPDEIVCDDDGALAARFGAQRLPAAYLWSWQGPLLVRAGRVEEVERAIESWLRDTPRVEVSVRPMPARSKVSQSALLELVRGQIRDQDKLIVIASEEERRRLDALKKRSLEARFDDTMQCEIGKELSANSLLDTAIVSGTRPRLSLSLLSVERGCLVAGAVVDWIEEKPNVGVAAAVAELMRKVRRPAESAVVASVAPPTPQAPPAAAAPSVAAVANPPAPTPTPTPRAPATASVGPDGDGDGVPDTDDKCPAHAETLNGFQDQDGCPDVLPNAVTTLLGRQDVRFDLNQAKLRSEGAAVIDKLAAVLREYPDLRVRIDVHSDSQGSGDYNLSLTKQRAETIRALLIRLGIDGQRLEAHGYGSDLPIADNRIAQGRAQNRRVEFGLLSPRAAP